MEISGLASLGMFCSPFPSFIPALTQVAAAVQQVGFKRVKRHGLPRPAAASGASAEADAWANLRLALDEDMDRERLASDFHVVHDENYYNRLQHSAKSHRSVDSVLGSKHSLSLSNAPLRVNVGRRDEKAWYNVARRTRLPAGALASFIQPWMGEESALVQKSRGINPS